MLAGADLQGDFYEKETFYLCDDGRYALHSFCNFGKCKN
jgi:hypothetical protein